ncbi:hypothetical protein [Neptunomonas sp.]|uniref:hypothetical protein n=1 Tax=Neptunomonas TaxID=75687 RepID=UPI003515526A
MKTNSQDRFIVLQTHIHRWLGQGAKKNVIAQAMVDKFHELGYSHSLAGSGICFQSTADPFNDNRVNTQKIMRWMGLDSSVNESREKLFEFEPVIVAAMPNDIRTSYLNAIYNPAGVLAVCSRTVNPDKVREVSAACLTKESSESVIAALELPAQPSLTQVIDAHREHLEASAAHQMRANQLENDYPNFLKQH